MAERNPREKVQVSTAITEALHVLNSSPREARATLGRIAAERHGKLAGPKPTLTQFRTAFVAAHLRELAKLRRQAGNR